MQPHARAADAEGMCGDPIRLVLEEPLTWRGRDCVVRGLDPMSVSERRVELEDVDTGERFRIPLRDLREQPPPGV
jgi:hypothetical protein